jgi:Phage integrase family
MKGVFATRRKEPRKMLPACELPEFLRNLRTHKGDPMIGLALRLVILTMVRTIELCGARWEEFDFERKLWLIPAERMKMRAPHVVPLSRQAFAVLEELRPISGGHDLVFPGRSERGKPISENTLLYALYRLGYHRRATTHGFRALASTILNESGLWRADADRAATRAPGAECRSCRLPPLQVRRRTYADDAVVGRFPRHRGNPQSRFFREIGRPGSTMWRYVLPRPGAESTHSAYGRWFDSQNTIPIAFPAVNIWPPTVGIDPRPGFQTGLMNGREARESGLWRKALEAPGATVPE